MADLKKVTVFALLVEHINSDINSDSDFISTPKPWKKGAHTYICCFYCVCVTGRFNSAKVTVYEFLERANISIHQCTFTFNLSASEHKKGASDVERIRGVINLD